MKTVSGNYGICYFQDCLEGMDSIKADAWELAFTDPPYNLNFKGKRSGIADYRNHPNKIYYDDDKPKAEYLNWCWVWLAELQRIAKGCIITPGRCNLFAWITHQIPNYQLSFWYREFSKDFHHYDPIVMYGKINNPSAMRDVWNIPITNCETNGDYLLHPCPKSYELVKGIIESQLPKSVIDPFLGSGTTAQVCEELGISWLGFELSEAYLPDIEKRIQRGIRDHEVYRKIPKKQLTLLS